MNDEEFKRSVVGPIEIPAQYLPGGYEENHEQPQ
jgi:hypothetical protein